MHEGVGSFEELPELEEFCGIDGQGIAERNCFDLNGLAQMQCGRIVRLIVLQCLYLRKAALLQKRITD